MTDKPSTRPPLDRARIKAFTRLMPILFVCYIIAYIDRNNVGIAKLTMGEDLPDFSSAVFGFGSGIFFLGYFLLEIPGSLIVEKWSARKWICRIMVTWGIMAAATAFVKTPTQFYIVRFLLGMAEAGFFPGVIVYLTHWFPAKDRAKAISYFLVASPIAMIIGPSISQFFIEIGRTTIVDGTAITSPDLLGLKGWQWIYIIWGLPAIVAGFVVLFFLTDKPNQATWLTDDEKLALKQELEKDRTSIGTKKHLSLGQALRNPMVLLLSLAYFGIVTANYGIELFLPSILKEWHNLEPKQAALLAIIPSLLVIPAQLINGWSSDRMRERRWHSVIPVACGALLISSATLFKDNLTMTIICFTIGAAGMKAYMPAFWSLPSLFLTSTAAAGTVGFINSVGNLGGFLGPWVLGFVHESSKSYDYGLFFISLTSLSSAALICFLPFRRVK
ncbi:MAG: MFS transporter [Pirellula sp.]|jgi:ACS family tartrate transporter-like MFS transporter|nr:MFS transporter [Pirellula sp.]